MNKTKFYIWLIVVEINIFFLWQLLELLIYGEIQPRIVDDIIALCWTYYIIMAYELGYSDAYNNKCNLTKKERNDDN